VYLFLSSFFLSYRTTSHWHYRYVCELYQPEGLSSVRYIKSDLTVVTTSDAVYLITQPINFMQQNPYWECNIVSASLENFRAFYVTRRVITRFIRAPYLPLFWTRWIESMAIHNVSLRLVVIFAHLLLRLRSWSVLMAFSHHNPICLCIPLATFHVRCHLTLLNLIIVIMYDDYKSWNSSLCIWFDWRHPDVLKV
jgi:hypothetical protein